MCTDVDTAICTVGQNHLCTVCIYGIFGSEVTKHTIICHIQCIYGIFGSEVTKHTVYMYGASVRFWPTLAICARICV